MLIISLSSIPPRFAEIGPTLESLLGQEKPADRIVLTIPNTYQRFPDWDGTLPRVPGGIEIKRCRDDFGPATKVLPVAADNVDQNADILLCDDDRDYARDWTKHFLDARKARPEAALCLRGLTVEWVLGQPAKKHSEPRAKVRPEKWDFEWHLRKLLRKVTPPYKRPERRRFSKSGYIDIFEGCSGVMLRSSMLPRDAWDIPKVAWSVDDIWLSGMLAKNNVPLWLIANVLVPENTEAQSQAPLAEEKFDGNNRVQANRATVRLLQERYGVWA